MKVFDCFLFNNELPILDLRYQELKDSVDCFYASESDLTHSGRRKPLYLNSEIRDKYPKLSVIRTDLTEYDEAWERENAQRNSLMKVLEVADDNDLILISDADEIPSITFIELAKENILKHKVILSKQYFYYYNFKYRKPNLCHGTIAVTKRTLNNTTFQDLRNQRFNMQSVIYYSGWHLSFFGDATHIQNKIASFAHTEFNKQEYLDLINIQENVDKGIDIFNRETPEEKLLLVNPKENILPIEVTKNPDKYKQWL